MEFEILKPIIMGLSTSMIFIYFKYRVQKQWEKDEMDMMGCCYSYGILEYSILFSIISIIFSILYIVIWNSIKLII